MKFLVDNDLDPLLIPFLSDKKEEQEEQVKILKNVIEKEQKKALKTDMLNNQFKPSGGGSGDIKPQGRNLNKFKPLKKEIRGMYLIFERGWKKNGKWKCTISTSS